MPQLHPSFLLPLVLFLAACASAGEAEADDDLGDTPSDTADAGLPLDAALPPDAGIVLPPLDADLREPIDAAGPPDAAPAPPDAATPSFFCSGHNQCDLMAHECCAFLPPDFTSGICGYGNILLGACILTARPDAGP